MQAVNYMWFHCSSEKTRESRIPLQVFKTHCDVMTATLFTQSMLTFSTLYHSYKPITTIKLPYKRNFSGVSNFAILWSKVVSLFWRVQFFANLKIHKMLIPAIWGCVFRSQSVSYTCNFGTDRFTCTYLYPG